MPEPLAAFLVDDVAAGREEPDAAALEAAADALIEHPIFAAWISWATAIWTSLKPVQDRKHAVNTLALTGVVLREIDGLPDRSRLQATLAAALRLQSLWLALYCEEALAGQAALLARWMRVLPVSKNPLLAGLLHAGLERMRQA